MVVTTETDELPEQRRVLLDLLLSRPPRRLHRLRPGRRLPAAGDGLSLRRRRRPATRARCATTRRARTRRSSPTTPASASSAAAASASAKRCSSATCSTSPSAASTSLITTSFGRSMVETECEMCGNCVSACPTGALQDKLSRFECRTWDATVGRHRLPLLRLRLQRPAARQGRPRRPGDARRSARARARATCASRAATASSSSTIPTGSPSRSCAATASSCRPRGTRPSTSWRGASPRSRDDARRRRARRLLVGALHQRGELPLPEVHARRRRHAQRRPLRAPLPRLAP